MYLTASGMTAAEVDEEEVGEQGWGDDVDIIIDDGESQLTLGAHAQRGLQYLVTVCVCGCVSVGTYSHTTCNKAAK